MLASTTSLRKRLHQPEILVAPGVNDALMAKLVEQAGFDAVYMTGAGVSQSTLGLPDVGLATFSEMLTRASQITLAVDIPLIADADTGYGNAVNVWRTVREYERTGIAALQMEDQTYPKRCGHFTGRDVVATEEMVGKIKAAVDARNDEDFLVIARTDARTNYGIDAALERAQAYSEAGADIIFIESPESVDEMRTAATVVDKPTMANMVEGGRTPQLSASELQELGYSLVIFPGAVGRAATWAVAQLLNELKSTGDTAGYRDRMFDIKEINRIVGLEEINEMARRYGMD